MVCKYKISLFEKCYSCGTRKKIYKCKKNEIILGMFTCRFCKYYEAKKEGVKEYDNIQPFSESIGENN